MCFLFCFVLFCFLFFCFFLFFVLSSFSKVVDRAANLEWLRGHFKATPLASFVPFLVLTLTILELVSGLFCAVGLGVLLAGGSSLISYLGSIMCGVTFLALFFGQRLAKDYAGAAALAPYFLVSLASIYITRVRMA